MIPLRPPRDRLVLQLSLRPMRVISLGSVLDRSETVGECSRRF